jgi:hypothetical protein
MKPKPLPLTPFLLTKRQLVHLFGSHRLVKMMVAANWFERIREGGPGKEALYSYESAKAAYERLKVGENPPPLACKYLQGPA